MAPLASESPEFIATAYLVRKLRTTSAFNALISSKLNQKQAGEIWLTAAQSFFAVTLLVDFEISVREALVLLALFGLQFLPYFQQYEGLLVFSGVYVALGVGVLVARRHHLRTVFERARRHASGSAHDPGASPASDL